MGVQLSRNIFESKDYWYNPFSTAEVFEYLTYEENLSSIVYPFFHDYAEGVVAQCFLGMTNKYKVQHRYVYTLLDFFSDFGGVYGAIFLIAQAASSIFVTKLKNVMVTSGSMKVDPTQVGSF